jgi:hypothetical protein
LSQSLFHTFTSVDSSQDARAWIILYMEKDSAYTYKNMSWRESMTRKKETQKKTPHMWIFIIFLFPGKDRHKKWSERRGFFFKGENTIRRRRERLLASWHGSWFLFCMHNVKKLWG